jgi:hypothetical protein
MILVLLAEDKSSEPLGFRTAKPPTPVMEEIIMDGYDR